MSAGTQRAGNDKYNTAVQSQMQYLVSAYFTSKQIPIFGVAEQHSKQTMVNFYRASW